MLFASVSLVQAHQRFIRRKSMATRISDVVTPELFTPYAQQLTLTKSSLIRSGALTRDKNLDALLAGGGLVFTEPTNDTPPYTSDNDGSDEHDPLSFLVLFLSFSVFAVSVPV